MAVERTEIHYVIREYHVDSKTQWSAYNEEIRWESPG